MEYTVYSLLSLAFFTWHYSFENSLCVVSICCWFHYIADGPLGPSMQWNTAAAAKSLQSCPTLCDPIDGSPPGSLSLGFSRQEHWGGLPFPSPMQESEK